ncbi:hypothetical protein [Streptomyces sp. DH37]|uniref:hypothetical protein n=1 Tax=Streptomyces sp. DH37 TaxID=3040122 RepID=UPI00244288C5|nr:hypothetical protein [Streptomyces sp. DH37]MDG9705528.1 hypothetical protein [Streptomyces sp. DH37]
MKFTLNPRREAAIADLAAANRAVEKADHEIRSAGSLPERAEAAHRREAARAVARAAEQRVTEEYHAELRRRG